MTSRSSSRPAALLLLLLGLGGAAAADPDPFKEHVDAAIRLYQQNDVEASIKEFEAAYALRQLPRLLLNLGQAHRKLGHAKEALGYYEFYLRAEPNPKPEIKAELETYVQQTRAMLEAAERMEAEKKAQEAAKTAPQEEVAPEPAPPPLLPEPVRPVPLVAPGASVQKTRPKPTPVYRRWWFWGAIGLATAGIVAGVVVATLPSSSSPGLPDIEIRDQRF